MLKLLSTSYKAHTCLYNSQFPLFSRKALLKWLTVLSLLCSSVHLFLYSFLGKAFEMAASKTKSRTIHDHFDPAGENDVLCEKKICTELNEHGPFLCGLSFLT